MTSPPGRQTLFAVPIRPKKSLGQHFLIDANIRDKIVDLLQAGETDHVVEIGPGTGALTTMLHARYPLFTALEIDPRAIEHLKANLPDLDIRQCDVARFDWPAFAAGTGKSLYVIGNLPYYVTSQVLFGLLDAYPHVAEAVLMMQREVAERLVAAPRTKAYGILSVLVQWYAEPELAFRVSKHVFRPKPDVESAVVRLVFRRTREGDPPVEPLWLRKVVKAAFNQRRKTLRNSLKAITAEQDIKLPEPWCNQRAEELAPEEFVELARYLERPV